eukprot:4570984-Prymnesium_polylepis.2
MCNAPCERSEKAEVVAGGAVADGLRTDGMDGMRAEMTQRRARERVEHTEFGGGSSARAA